MTAENEQSQERIDPLELWHTLSRVIRSRKKIIEKELEGLSLKPMELRVLLSLSREDSIPMNSLAARNDVTGPWITGIVDDLESKGYATKIRSSSDRRIIRVSITPKGLDISSQGMKIYTMLIENALKNLTRDEALQLKHILERIDEGKSGQDS